MLYLYFNCIIVDHPLHFQVSTVQLSLLPRVYYLALKESMFFVCNNLSFVTFDPNLN